MILKRLCGRLTRLLFRRNLRPGQKPETLPGAELSSRNGVHPAERLTPMEFKSAAAANDQMRTRGWTPLLDSLFQDGRYAIRRMRRGPGFAIITIATLAVGIGLSGFIYTLLNFLILRPLPGVPQPDQLQLVQNPVPYPWFEHYRDLGKAPWTAAAFIGPVPCSVAVEGLAAERISCALVSPEYFATLRVQPLLGRLFNPQLERVGAAPTVVVTEQFWRTRLRAAPSTVGRTVRVNGYTVPILGVAPRGFAGIGTGSTTGPAVFIPATADAAIAPELQGDALHRTTQPAFQVFVRLTQGATIAAAEMRLDSETRVLDPRNEQKGRLVMLIAAGTVLPLPKAARIAILTLFGMLIALVLGLTCANLGGLLLARGIAVR